VATILPKSASIGGNGGRKLYFSFTLDGQSITNGKISIHPKTGLYASSLLIAEEAISP